MTNDPKKESAELYVLIKPKSHTFVRIVDVGNFLEIRHIKKNTGLCYKKSTITKKDLSNWLDSYYKIGWVNIKDNEK